MEIIINRNHNDPFASYTAQILGRKIGKVSTKGMENAAFLSTHLMEIFKNHKLMKIFQREGYETDRIVSN